MSANYGKTITIKRTYYTTDPNGLGASQKVGHAVADGTDDMSEPYYYLSGSHDGMPRIESLAFSCVTAGLESFFFTKADSGIASTDALFTALNTGNNKAVGFIGSGNYDSVSHLLPADVTVTLVTNASVMEANVKSGALVAGYNSEGTTGDNAVRARAGRISHCEPSIANSALRARVRVGARARLRARRRVRVARDDRCPPTLRSGFIPALVWRVTL